MSVSPARKLLPEEEALYSQALFTPKEVQHLQKRFKSLDFVSLLSLPSLYFPLPSADAARRIVSLSFP